MNNADIHSPSYHALKAAARLRATVLRDQALDAALDAVMRGIRGLARTLHLTRPHQHKGV